MTLTRSYYPFDHNRGTLLLGFPVQCSVWPQYLHLQYTAYLCGCQNLGNHLGPGGILSNGSLNVYMMTRFISARPRISRIETLAPNTTTVTIGPGASDL
jgi:hypothetical protein